MSGYNYGGNPPQYPPPQIQLYPQLYPGNVQPGFPMPAGQNQFPQQPGFAYPGYPGVQPIGQQVVQPGMPGHPASMSYPGIAPTPTMPSAPPAYGHPGFPIVTPQTTPTVEWIPTTPQQAAAFGDRAVVAGYEGHDGSPLWVIRSRFQGDLIPGKLAVKHQAAYVPWGGKENVVKDVEICCARPETVKWVEAKNGVIVPPNAIIAGNTAAGEPLYVGRARQQGSLTPGKVHPSHKAMYISFAGKEIAHKAYEVLCKV